MIGLLLNTKDVQVITGKSEKTARMLIQKVRIHSGKPKDVPLTIYDLCAMLKCEIGDIMHFVKPPSPQRGN